MDAHNITKSFGGKWCGTYGMIRCPAHDDSNPSCKVSDDDRKSDGIDVVCFAGCDWKDVKAALGKAGYLKKLDQYIQRPQVKVLTDPLEPDERAMKIWDASVPIAGTIAEVYLQKHRGLKNPMPSVLRYNTTYGLVAAMQRIDGTVIAVQVTYLDEEGAKSKRSVPRLTIGPMGTGAVRLAEAGYTLGLAEGVETALSAIALTALPTWATLGSGRLGNITLPPVVGQIVIFGDNGAAGHAAAEKAAKKYEASGYKVGRWFPSAEWDDYNTMLRKLVPSTR